MSDDDDKNASAGVGSNRLPALAAEILKAHADVQDAAKTALERAIAAGHALIEAKALVKHGEWLPWLRENCTALSERSAQDYMRLAAHEAKLGLANPQRAADLSIRDALEVITGGPMLQSFEAWARAIHPGIKFHPTGLEIPEGLTLEQWKLLGGALGSPDDQPSRRRKATRD